MRSRPSIVLLAAGALALGGCGGESATLGAEAAEDLRGQVEAVRAAAEEGDRAGALDALDGLAADVKDLEAGGSLAKADAAALRRGIGRARRRVRAEIAEPTPDPTPAPTATPEPTAEPTATPVPTVPEEDDADEEGGEPGTGNDEKKGKGESQGKGKGKEKGGD